MEHRSTLANVTNGIPSTSKKLYYRIADESERKVEERVGRLFVAFFTRPSKFYNLITLITY